MWRTIRSRLLKGMAVDHEGKRLEVANEEIVKSTLLCSTQCRPAGQEVRAKRESPFNCRSYHC